jgi:hypothetical protein
MYHAAPSGVWMRTRLIQFEQRVLELEKMAEEVMVLAERFSNHEEIQPQLSIKTQTWYHAAHGFLEKVYPEKVEWLEHCIDGDQGMIAFVDMVHPWPLNELKPRHVYFLKSFATARGLVRGSLERAKSLEYDTLIHLSSALVTDEFDTAHQLSETAKGDESILRAAGMIGRVALERHLFTVAEAKAVTIEVNPSTKKATAQDAMNSLEKAGVITKIQKSELESLFRIGNNCAHPKESIKDKDIERLLQRGKELTVTIA